MAGRNAGPEGGERAPDITPDMELDGLDGGTFEVALFTDAIARPDAELGRIDNRAGERARKVGIAGAVAPFAGKRHKLCRIREKR